MILHLGSLVGSAFDAQEPLDIMGLDRSIKYYSIGYAAENL